LPGCRGLATAAGFSSWWRKANLAVAASGASFGVNGIDVGLFCATPSRSRLVRNMLPNRPWKCC
jgi:hypothetical protein